MSSVIIFGGSRGIGKIIAEHLMVGGHEVSVASRNLVTLDKFKRSYSKKGFKVNTIKADITIERDVVNAFKSHKVEWLSTPDVVINCAALQGPIGNTWSVPIKKWEETIKTNLCGSYIVARAAINQMIEKGCGSIIMFSGGGAAYSRPNFSAYSVSKTGILRLVENIGDELKLAGYHNIIINAVAPGAVKTKMTSEVLKAGYRAGEKSLEEAAYVFKKGGTPSLEICSLIDFLIDKEANRGLTGRLIHVRENYKLLSQKFGANVPDDIGKIRRIPI